jgi:hypothetical protein
VGREDDKTTAGAQNRGDIVHAVIDRSAGWRIRAEEMRTTADDTHDPIERAMMLRIAGDYARLAKEHMTARRGQNSN